MAAEIIMVAGVIPLWPMEVGDLMAQVLPEAVEVERCVVEAEVEDVGVRIEVCIFS